MTERSAGKASPRQGLLTDVSVLANRADRVGEGPTWIPAALQLAWVDILDRELHVLTWATGTVVTRQLPQQVGAVVPRAHGGFLLALEDGFWVTDGDGGDLERYAAVEADDPTTRMNDAKCDRAGRLWAGTMAHDARAGAGSLYRLDPDGAVTKVLDGVSISNGIDWSPDDRTMYYIDSATYQLDVFDYDIRTGTPIGRRPLIRFPEADGMPDGMAVDRDGALWIAFYDGWSVRRYLPTGDLDKTIRLPVARVTSCAFAGATLADLVVTTARSGLTAAQRADQPLAGALFHHHSSVPGRPPSPFAG